MTIGLCHLSVLVNDMLMWNYMPSKLCKVFLGYLVSCGVSHTQMSRNALVMTRLVPLGTNWWVVLTTLRDAYIYISILFMLMIIAVRLPRINASHCCIMSRMSTLLSILLMYNFSSFLDASFQVLNYIVFEKAMEQGGGELWPS